MCHCETVGDLLQTLCVGKEGCVRMPRASSMAAAATPSPAPVVVRNNVQVQVEEDGGEPPAPRERSPRPQRVPALVRAERRQPQAQTRRAPGREKAAVARQAWGEEIGEVGQDEEEGEENWHANRRQPVLGAARWSTAEHAFAAEQAAHARTKKALDAEYVRLRRDYERMRTRCARAVDEARAHREQAAKLEGELRLKVSVNERLASDKERLERQLEQQAQHNRQLDSKIALGTEGLVLSRQNKLLREKYAEAQSRVESLTQQLNHRDMQLNKAKTEIAVLTRTADQALRQHGLGVGTGADVKRSLMYQLSEKRQEVHDLALELADKSDAERQLAQRVSELEVRVQGEHEAHLEHRMMAEQMSRDLGAERQHSAQLQLQFDRVSEERIAFETRVQQEAARAVSAEQRVETLSSRLDQANAELETLRLESQQMRDQIEEAKQQLHEKEEARRRVAALTEQHITAEREKLRTEAQFVESQKARMEGLVQEVERLNSEADRLNAENSAVNARVEELQRDLEQTAQERNRYRTELHELRASKDVVATRLSSTISELKEQSAEVTKQKAEELDRALEERDKAQSELQAVRASKDVVSSQLLSTIAELREKLSVETKKRQTVELECHRVYNVLRSHGIDLPERSAEEITASVADSGTVNQSALTSVSHVSGSSRSSRTASLQDNVEQHIYSSAVGGSGGRSVSPLAGTGRTANSDYFSPPRSVTSTTASAAAPAPPNGSGRATRGLSAIYSGAGGGLRYQPTGSRTSVSPRRS